MKQATPPRLSGREASCETYVRNFPSGEKTTGLWTEKTSLIFRIRRFSFSIPSPRKIRVELLWRKANDMQRERQPARRLLFREQDGILPMLREFVETRPLFNKIEGFCALSRSASERVVEDRATGVASLTSNSSGTT